jgi:hypothetical protein
MTKPPQRPHPCPDKALNLRMNALIKYCLVVLIGFGLATMGMGCGKKKAPAPQRSIKKVHYEKSTGRYYYVVREKAKNGGDSWYYYWLMDANNNGAPQYYETHL